MVKDSEKDRTRKTGHPQKKDREERQRERQDTHNSRQERKERQDTHNSSENPASTRTNCPYPN
jgi:hypothetical protein